MRFLAAAAATLAVLGFAACGGEDRLSREEYLEQADATCRKYEERLKPLEDKLQQTDSTEEAAAVIDDAVPVVREGVDELKKLKPPEELEGQVDEWLKLNEENTKTLEQLGDAAEAGDEARIGELAQEAEANEQRGDDLAREIGLKDCAEDD